MATATFTTPLTLTPAEAATLGRYLTDAGEAGRSVAVAVEDDGLHILGFRIWSGAFGTYAQPIEPDDDVTEPEHPAEPTVDHRGTTVAERQVLAALSGTEPRTPAELKRRMPGAVPVAYVRSLLDSLRVKGLAAVRMAPGATGTTTRWVSVGAGVAHSEAERQASLDAAEGRLPLTAAEQAVYGALRRTVGRKVSDIAKTAGHSKDATQALLESLEAQGHARQYPDYVSGTLWRQR